MEYRKRFRSGNFRRDLALPLIYLLRELEYCQERSAEIVITHEPKTNPFELRRRDLGIDGQRLNESSPSGGRIALVGGARRG